MWLLIIKNLSKDEALRLLTMATDYKQVRGDIHCQYYTKRDANEDLSNAQNMADKPIESEIRNLGRHNSIISLY